MPKSFSTFLEDCDREIPDDVVRISEEVDPAHYDVTAIIKHLGAMKKFPMLLLERPLNLHGRVSEIKMAMNFAVSQRKAQIASGVPEEMSRPEMAEACLEREAQRISPIVIDKDEAPVKEVAVDQRLGKQVIQKYTRDPSEEIVQATYQYALDYIVRPPYPTREGIAEVLRQSPSPDAKKAVPDSFIDPSVVKELDDQGFFQKLGMQK